MHCCIAPSRAARNMTGSMTPSLLVSRAVLLGALLHLSRHLSFSFLSAPKNKSQGSTSGAMLQRQVSSSPTADNHPDGPPGAPAMEMVGMGCKGASTHPGRLQSRCSSMAEEGLGPLHKSSCNSSTPPSRRGMLPYGYRGGRGPVSENEDSGCTKVQRSARWMRAVIRATGSQAPPSPTPSCQAASSTLSTTRGWPIAIISLGINGQKQPCRHCCVIVENHIRGNKRHCGNILVRIAMMIDAIVKL